MKDLLSVLLLIAMVLAAFIAGYSLFMRLKNRKTKNGTVIPATFLSAELLGGNATMNGDRGRIATGNTYVRTAFQRLSFLREDTGETLNFTVDEDVPIMWNNGDNGMLTFAKKTFISFQKA